MEESDRDAGVGGELAEDATMPGGRGLSSGSPEVFKNNINPRFTGKKKGSPAGEPSGGVGPARSVGFFRYRDPHAVETPVDEEEGDQEDRAPEEQLRAGWHLHRDLDGEQAEERRELDDGVE